MNKEREFPYIHPAVILGYFASVTAFTMCVFHPAFIVISVAASLLCMLLIGRENVLRTLGTEIILFVLISIVNPLFSANGSTVIFTYFSRPFTLEALAYGMCAAAVFCGALQWLSCFGALFTEEKFVSLFSEISPSVTLLFAMVLKLIPELRQKLMRIKEDRKRICKGTAEGVTGKTGVSAENLSALTGWALESAADTAASMNARGFGSGKRSSYAKYRFRARDAILFAIILLNGGFIAAALLNGGASAVFYPRIDMADAAGTVLAAYALLMLLPVIIWISETLKWHISTSKI